VTAFELARRDTDGNLVPWTLLPDGSERTYDEGTHAALAALAAAVAEVLTVADTATHARLEQVAGLLAGTVTVAGEVRDEFRGGEVLGEQAGPGVLDFTFVAPVQLVWVRAHGGDARCDPFGGAPGPQAGIPCDDGVPQPITLTTAQVRVWAPDGVAVAVWGYRYDEAAS
jgi:hypothetical protein